jgi:hypothetical protein
MISSRARRVSGALATMSALALLTVGCEPPPEEGPDTDVIHQAVFSSCATICGPQKSCATACSVSDSQGSYTSSCGIFLNGTCDKKNPAWEMPKDNPPPPPSGGSFHEPFFCSGPGPYEVQFWEHGNYGGRCVTRSARYIGGGQYADFFDRWIESNSGLNAFYNDKLSAVAVGTRVTLEIFNNADFGQSFGTWAPGKWISYVGDYANDKMSSYKIRVVK